ncbi:MAG: trigger factor [Candidatus Muiribacteriota bacterium]
MQVKEIERNNDGNVSYKVTLPSEKVDNAIERVYKDLVKRVNIPGFRKGKVPKKVLEVRVGKEYFEEEAKKMLLEESFYDAFKNIDDKVLKQDLDDLELEVGKGFSYVIKLETVPDVDISEETYKNLNIELEKEEYTEEKYKKNLEEFLEKHGTKEEVKDRGLKEGDNAVINFLGKIDGEPFEGGKADNYNLKIGSGSFIDNFEEQLEGMKPEDKKTVKVTFPKSYQQEKLAGKEAEFDVELLKIEAVKLPEIDEELLKKINYKTEEELKEDFVNKTKEQVEKNNKIQLENKIIDKIISNLDLTPPDSMINYIVDTKINEFEQNMKKYFPNLTLDDYLKATNSDRGALKKNYEESAGKQALIELVMKNIARIEGIQVENDDIDVKLKEVAQNMKQDAQKIKESLKASGNLSLVKEEILMEKTIDFIKNAADIKEKNEGEKQEG